MSKERISRSFRKLQPIWLLIVGLLTAQIAIAQIVPQFHSQMTSETAALTLPDAPEAVSSSVDPGGSSSAFAEAAFDPASRPVRQKAMASPTTKYIAPGQQVPSLSIGNKTLLGIKDAVSPFSMAGWILSAGYSHVTNGSPNYGTNSDAFGQRFGASVARDISEGVFSDSIMASVLREDPRYYKMGPGHSFIRRVVYAGTRPLIGRTDGGRTTPNFALLTGTLGGAVLTDAYYPQINRGFTQTAETFGTSIGGDALGFVVSEFLSETLQIVHLKKAD